jgi:hypothetical protein
LYLTISHTLYDLWKNALRILILISVLFRTSISIAQVAEPDRHVEVDGTMVFDGGKVSGAKITIEKNGRNAGNINVPSSGKFEFNLDFESEYIITFTQEGAAPKKIKFITRAPEDAKKDGIMPFTLDVLVHAPMTGADPGTSPYTTIKFDNSTFDFEYDKPEMKSISEQRKKLEPIKAEYEKKKAEEMKAKQEAIAKRYAEEEAARKKAQEEEIANEKYATIISAADKAFQVKDYEFAKGKYQEAAAVKPAEAHPKARLSEIDKILGDLAKEKEAAEKFAAAMTAADKAMAAKDYTTAKQKYTEASGLKPADPLPKEKLKEVDALIAAAAKEKELETKYAAAVQAGEKALLSKDLITAKAKFTEAAGLKPAESLPKTKLSEIETLIESDNAKKAQEKELTEKYNAQITAGDKAMAQKDLAKAREAYEAAIGLKPNEAYPKGKLKEIEGIEAADKQKAAKEKEINDKYIAAVNKADAAFSSKDYTAAKASYLEAQQIKPTEKYPIDRLKETENLIFEMQKSKDAEEKYKAAKAKGDKLFQGKDYSGASIAFKEALNYKPGDDYSKEKIEEIDKLLAAELEAKKIADAEAKKKAQEEADRKLEEARLKAEADAKAKAEAAAKAKAEADAKLAAEQAKRAEADAKAKEEAAQRALKAEEEMRKAKEAAKIAEEERLRKKAEDDAKLEAEMAKKAEADRIKAELEAKRRAEEEAKEAELAAKRRLEEEEIRKKQEAENKKLQEKLAKEAEEARKLAEIEKRKRAAEDEARRIAAEAAKREADKFRKERMMMENAEVEASQEARKQARMQRWKDFLKQEEEKRNRPYIVIRKYSYSTPSIYGYLNMGDGTGMKDITEQEFKQLVEKYKGLNRAY